MENTQSLVSEQHFGVQKNASETVEFENWEAAQQFFQIARKRLLDVNNWQTICSGLSSTFILRDNQGQSVGHRFPEVGDYFQIDIPGPGNAAGDGHDWVLVEAMEDRSDAGGDLTSIRVRPASSPLNDQPDVAHFLDEAATSTFLVSRIGTSVTAEVHGRNEAANTHTDSLLDKVRNVATAVGAWLGFADVQWKSLAKALVDQEKQP